MGRAWWGGVCKAVCVGWSAVSCGEALLSWQGSCCAGAVSAPEAQLAALPAQAAATGNGSAHRAGYTYPTTWLGTLPQIAPLSGVSPGAPSGQHPLMSLAPGRLCDPPGHRDGSLRL